MNEFIAYSVNEILSRRLGTYNKIHPNGHVNMSQSTSDVIPTAGKLTVLDLLNPLIKAYQYLNKSLLTKSDEFDNVIKMGMTQLLGAVPIRLGQTFHSYASMIKRNMKRLEAARKEMYTLNLGATAIDSAINVSEFYLYSIIPCLGALNTTLRMQMTYLTQQKILTVLSPYLVHSKHVHLIYQKCAIICDCYLLVPKQIYLKSISWQDKMEVQLCRAKLTI